MAAPEGAGSSARPREHPGTTSDVAAAAPRPRSLRRVNPLDRTGVSRRGRSMQDNLDNKGAFGVVGHPPATEPLPRGTTVKLRLDGPRVRVTALSSQRPRGAARQTPPEADFVHDDRQLIEERLRRALRERIRPAIYGAAVPLDIQVW